MPLQSSSSVYTTRLTVPHKTPDTSPVFTTLSPLENTILYWEIKFPRGCAALVGVRLIYGGERLAPAGGGDPWLRGDGESVVWTGETKVDSISPVRIEGYSDDAIYDHKIIVRMDFGQRMER